MQSRSVPIDTAIDCDTLSTLEVTARNSFLPRLRDRSDSDRNDFCSRLAQFIAAFHIASHHERQSAEQSK
jgi:hypothetical protein